MAMESTQYCFLTPLQPHENLLQELSRTSLLLPILGEDLPPQNHLITLFMARYRGLPSNWILTEYKVGYLFDVPDWLFSDEPVLDSEYWEVYHSITITPWRSLSQTHRLTNPSKEVIVIRNFPIDFWDEVYFRQATSNMGNWCRSRRSALKVAQNLIYA